jgi:hypothetical protein
MYNIYMQLNKNFWLECQFRKPLPQPLNSKFDHLLCQWRVTKNKDGYYYGFGSNPKSDVFGLAGVLTLIHPEFVPYIKTLKGYINSETMGVLSEDMLSDED